MNHLDEVKTDLTEIARVDYSKVDTATSERNIHLFLEEFLKYEEMIAFPEKYKIKVDKEAEYSFEEEIITKALESHLFASLDEFEEKLTDFIAFERDMQLGEYERPKIKKPKLTPSEKVEIEIENMVKAGISREEAEEIVAEKFMKKRGIVKCAYCERAINMKTEAYRYDPMTKKYYHVECYDEAVREFIFMPLISWDGVEIHCKICGDLIYNKDLFTYDYPEGFDWDLIRYKSGLDPEALGVRYFHARCKEKEEEVKRRRR